MTERLAYSPGEVAETRAIVYRFYDRDATLLYVGLTVTGMTRWQAHAISQPWWTEVAGARIEHFASVREAAAAEAIAIQTEHPIFNVLHRYPTRVRPRSTRRRSGSVYQRSSDGRWVAARSSGPRGHRRVVLRYADTRAEAERALAEIR